MAARNVSKVVSTWRSRSTGSVRKSISIGRPVGAGRLRAPSGAGAKAGASRGGGTVTADGRGAGRGRGGEAGGWAWPPLDVTGWASADALTARPIKAAHLVRPCTSPHF
jgi:hypothetical protein